MARAIGEEIPKFILPPSMARTIGTFGETLMTIRRAQSWLIHCRQRLRFLSSLCT